MPERIQLRRARGWRKPEGAIVVSRPTKWGNPIRITPDLACWCPPRRMEMNCHADVLLDLANSDMGRENPPAGRSEGGIYA